jgi:hypothetical protein
MLLMFSIMMPMMLGQELRIIDLDQAALWRDELWFIERTVKMNWRAPESSASTLALRRVTLADLLRQARRFRSGPTRPIRARPCCLRAIACG